MGRGRPGTAEPSAPPDPADSDGGVGEGGRDGAGGPDNTGRVLLHGVWMS